ncbi:MAG TPA: hypothetical protein VMU18_09335 [Rhodoblastus sp.]|nr:hypothetical protein [Rhodoblastus sp.]
MDYIADLLRVIDVYRSAAGVTDSTLSTRIFNEGMKVKRLRAGADMNTRRVVVALRWLSSHWPEGVEWPEDVRRPRAGGVD